MLTQAALIRCPPPSSPVRGDVSEEAELLAGLEAPPQLSRVDAQPAERHGGATRPSGSASALSWSPRPCNIGIESVVQANNPALSRARLSWVDQNYVRGETIAAATARFVDAQGDIPLAQVWGGGEVAFADGLRFVVPVRTLNAGPNPPLLRPQPRRADSTGGRNTLINGGAGGQVGGG